VPAGIVLYMMLTGKNPFEDESFHKIIQAILEREPAPIPDVPPEIWDVVERALTKNPSERYGDGTELLIALMKASGRRSLSEPSLLAARVPSDSTITVPPVGTQSSVPETGIDEEGLPEAARRPRRAMRIVIGAVGLSLVIALAALIRGQLAAPVSEQARMPKAVAIPAPEPPPAAVAPLETAAPTPSPVAPAAPVPHSAPSGSIGTAAAAPPPPAGARREAPAKKDPSPAKKEPPAPPPKVATDPGF
jgi:hypothetical protein